MQNTRELRPLSLQEIAIAAKDTQAYRIFLHWSAGHYHQVYSDYHLSIDADGKIYAPYNNLDFDQYRQATYMRNSGSINIAVCGCYDACANSGYNLTLGSEPVTTEQIEALAQVIATLCINADIDLDSVLTHQEIATIDGYGPGSGDSETRWDLWYLPDVYGANGKLVPGGELLRGKAAFYMKHM